MIDWQCHIYMTLFVSTLDCHVIVINYYEYCESKAIGNKNIQAWRNILLTKVTSSEKVKFSKPFT